MTRDEFLQFLERFARQPIPSTDSRHVYLWQASLDDLVAKAPRQLVKNLNLHELCSKLERSPVNLAAARQALDQAITGWLSQEFPRDDQQRVLAVTGCDLLARYQVPVATFTQLASEYRLVAFVVPKADSSYRPSRPLPFFVRLQSDSTFSYLKNYISENLIIGE